MKKLISFLLVAVLMFTLASCGDEKGKLGIELGDNEYSSVDADLTAMTQPMMYATLVNMANSGGYTNDIVKISGILGEYTDGPVCAIATDETACCFLYVYIFINGEDIAYPDDYPMGETVEVTGRFGIFRDSSGSNYVALFDANVIA